MLASFLANDPVLSLWLMKKVVPLDIELTYLVGRFLIYQGISMCSLIFIYGWFLTFKHFLRKLEFKLSYITIKYTIFDLLLIRKFSREFYFSQIALNDIFATLKIRD